MQIPKPVVLVISGHAICELQILYPRLTLKQYRRIVLFIQIVVVVLLPHVGFGSDCFRLQHTTKGNERNVVRISVPVVNLMGCVAGAKIEVKRVMARYFPHHVETAI